MLCPKTRHDECSCRPRETCCSPVLRQNVLRGQRSARRSVWCRGNPPVGRFRRFMRFHAHRLPLGGTGGPLHGCRRSRGPRPWSQGTRHRERKGNVPSRAWRLNDVRRRGRHAWRGGDARSVRRRREPLCELELVEPRPHSVQDAVVARLTHSLCHLPLAGLTRVEHARCRICLTGERWEKGPLPDIMLQAALSSRMHAALQESRTHGGAPCCL